MDAKAPLTISDKMRRNSDSHPPWLPGKSPQFVATIVVNLVSFSFGSAVGWPSVAGPQLLALGVAEETLSWIVALIWPTGLAGAMVFGSLTERWGRRLSGLLVALPLAAGWAALLLSELWFDADVVDTVVVDSVNQTVADNITADALSSNVDKIVGTVLLGRVLLGVGMGGALILCPMYVGEVVEDSLRGQLGSYMAMFINAGILYVYAVGMMVGWGALAVLCGMIPIVFILLFFWLPETPVFMLSRGDERGAFKSLMWLRDPSGDDVDSEMSALKASLKHSDTIGSAADITQTVGPRDLVATRGSRHALVIVLGLVVLQQFSGITAILNYAATIFDMAGSALQPELSAVVVAAVQMVGSFASCGLADSLGRLPLLYASYGGMSVSLGILGACFCWPGTLPSWLPVACLSVFVLVYAVGSGPAPFVLLVDVFPSHLRAMASQTGLCCLFTLAFLVSKFFPMLSAVLGPAGCFWLFTVSCSFGVFFIRVAIPETKGRAVSDIVAELEGVREDGSSSSSKLQSGV